MTAQAIERKIQVFDLTHLSVREAFDKALADAKFQDGDVLHLVTGATAVMVGPWPTLVKGIADGFHQLPRWQSWETLEGGKYAESAKEACIEISLLDEGSMLEDEPENYNA